MSERRADDLVRDIVEAARRAVEYCAAKTYDEFKNDTKTQDAAIRNIEIIGEAAKGLPESYRDAHPDIAWKSISGMRDKLIHHYFGVNIDIVWDVVKTDLPQVLATLSTPQDRP